MAEEATGTLVTLESLRESLPKGLSFEQALESLQAAGDVLDSTELGDGFTVVSKDDKRKLVGVPFIILDWQVNDGDFGEFSSLRLITQQGQRLILNDGSTGIFQQMKALEAAGESRAILCRHGLRASDYTYQDSKTGEERPATTYYLDIAG